MRWFSSNWSRCAGPTGVAAQPHCHSLPQGGLQCRNRGLAGIQELAGNATHLFYRTEEALEGRDAFLEKRPPDFGETGWLP